MKNFILYSFLGGSLLIISGCFGSDGGNVVTPPIDTGTTEYAPVDPGMQTQQAGGSGAIPVPTVSKGSGGDLLD